MTTTFEDAARELYDAIVARRDLHHSRTANEELASIRRLDKAVTAFEPFALAAPKLEPTPPSIVVTPTDDRMAIARVNRAKDSRDVKPPDLLRTMAHDIETGRIQVDGLVLIWMWRPADKAWDAGTYRCNMGSDQELVAIELAKERCIRQWLKRSN